MRILFVEPSPSNRPGPAVPALGPAYLAATAAARGHEVFITPLGATQDEITETAKKLRPHAAGFTLFSPTAKHAEKTALSVKPFADFLIAGGPHPSAIQKDQLPHQIPWAHGIIKGEGENALLPLLQELSTTKDKKIIKTGPRTEDLDSLPFPLRNPISIERSYHPLLGKRTIPVLTSRGCPHTCLFCDKSVTGSKYRARSPQNVIKELIELKKLFNTKNIVFYDDNFCHIKERVFEICRDIEKTKLNITWKCECRADDVDEKMLLAMKRAGCKVISLGIESANQTTLDMLRKGFDVKTAEHAVKAAKAAGLEVLAYFILGAPGETLTDVKNTIKFALKCGVDYAQFSLLSNYPGSALHKIANHKDSKIIKTGSPLDIGTRSSVVSKNINIPPSLLVKAAYASFYLRPQTLYKILTHT